MKVLILLAKGFEMMEFSVFVDVLGWARTGFHQDITTVTCGFHKEVISTFCVPLLVDQLISEIKVEDYDALAIPGGFEEFGFYEEAYQEAFLNIIRDFNSSNKPIASICVAALPVAKSGVLENRKATTYHLNNGKRQQQLRDFGVNVINEPMVIDNNIITSYCPQTAPGVAFLLLKMLTSQEVASTVKIQMGFAPETN